MIRIEDFLFVENIEPSLAETLLTEYPNLQFSTSAQFYDYFEAKNIRLVKKTTVATDKQSLLQRFKDFKTSADYQAVKKYIAEQRKIKDAVLRGDILEATTILSSFNVTDPFFDFVARKILTGNDDGVLPSEQLQVVLDDMARRAEKDIDTDVDVIRDDRGTVQSFKNYLKNIGALKINLLDERFLIDSFRYVVDTSFKQLDEAVNAEVNVLRKARELTDLSTDTATLNENLKKLIVEESKTIPALQNKVETLTEKTTGLEELLEQKNESLDDLTRVIEELSDQRNKLVDELEAKDETIVQLNETIDSTLSSLGEKVNDQLENSADAFDELSSKLEEQARKNEEALAKANENSAKQLESFEKALGSLATALTPKEPDTPEVSPDDTPEEKRRKEKIQQIQEKWGGIKYISTSNDDYLDTILKKVGSSIGSGRATFVDLTGALTSRVSQVYSWNTTYSQQFKQLMNVYTIKTEKDADEILTLVNKLQTTSQSEGAVRDFLYNSNSDVFDAWREDVGQSRGDNEGKVRDIYGLVGLQGWNTQNGKPVTLPLEQKLSSMSFDTIIEVLGIVNTFPNKRW